MLLFGKSKAVGASYTKITLSFTFLSAEELAKCHH